MGRPPGRPKREEVVEEIIEKPVEEKSTKELRDEALNNKAIMDSLDSDKAKKDVMIMTAKDLEAHLEYLRVRMAEMDNEYVSRRKIIDGINGSIAGAMSELSRLRDDFEKKNKVMIDKLNAERAEVEKADKTLQALIQSNNEIKRANEIETGRLLEHRLNCDRQVAEMKKALADNQSEWAKREADILKREGELKLAQATLEEEKSAIAPEQAKLSAVKNENILLIQELDRERNNLRNFMLGIESEKQALEEARLIQESKNEQAQLTISNQEKKLREWEQNLKDLDLDVRARGARADRQLIELQKQKEIAGIK